MTIDDSTIADLVADKFAGEEALFERVKERIASLLDKAMLVTPKVAAELLKVDQRTLSQVATPIRLTNRVTRYRLSEITHLSQ